MEDKTASFRATPEAQDAIRTLTEQLGANQSQAIRLALLFTATKAKEFTQFTAKHHRKTW